MAYPSRFQEKAISDAILQEQAPVAPPVEPLALENVKKRTIAKAVKAATATVPGGSQAVVDANDAGPLVPKDEPGRNRAHGVRDFSGTGMKFRTWNGRMVRASSYVSPRDRGHRVVHYRVDGKQGSFKWPMDANAAPLNLGEFRIDKRYKVTNATLEALVGVHSFNTSLTLGYGVVRVLYTCSTLAFENAVARQDFGGDFNLGLCIKEMGRLAKSEDSPKFMAISYYADGVNNEAKIHAPSAIQEAIKKSHGKAPAKKVKGDAAKKTKTVAAKKTKAVAVKKGTSNKRKIIDDNNGEGSSKDVMP